MCVTYMHLVTLPNDLMREGTVLTSIDNADIPSHDQGEAEKWRMARMCVYVTAGLHHSHSNAGSELRLQPLPQLMAMPDP